MIKRVLTTSAFFVCSLLAIFGRSPEISTSEVVPQAVPAEGVSLPVAETHRFPETSPVEDFTGEIAYKVLRVIDGDTVKIYYNRKPTNVRRKDDGYV